MLKRGLHKVSLKRLPLDEINSGRMKSEQAFINADAQLNRAESARAPGWSEIRDNEAKNALLASNEVGILRQILLTKQKALGNLKDIQTRIVKTHGRALSQEQNKFITDFEKEINALKIKIARLGK